MSRTRRRPVALDDDPRKPRKFRQKSGVNLIHEEPWFGFNVAEKMPHRDDLDPAENVFEGFSRLIIAFQELTKNEFGTNEVDNRVLASGDTNAERAVDTSNLKDDLIASSRLFPLRDVADQNNVPAIPNGVKMHIDDVRGGIAGGRITGTVPAGNLPDIAGLNGQLPGSQISGTVPAGNLPSIGGLSGDLPADKLPNIPASKLPNIDGAKIQKNSIPSNRLHDVHGSKISGKSSVPWSMINVSGVVFTHGLNAALRKLENRLDNKYAKKGHNHGP